MTWLAGPDGNTCKGGHYVADLSRQTEMGTCNLATQCSMPLHVLKHCPMCTCTDAEPLITTLLYSRQHHTAQRVQNVTKLESMQLGIHCYAVAMLYNGAHVISWER